MSDIVGLRHSYRYLRQDMPSVRLLKARNRGVHGHLVTLHQSGSHWLNFMLAECLRAEYELPELIHIRDRSIIARPQDPIVHPRIPRILQSHAIPSPLVHSAPLRRLLKFPRYVLLIRDLRACLVSYFEKSKKLEPFRIPFSQFLRNERVIENPIRRDLWNRIRFLNAWSRDRQRLPAEQLIVVRYEDLKADPTRELQRVWSFLELPPAVASRFDQAVAAASKDRMSHNEHPEQTARIVRTSARHPFEWFSAADRQFFTHTVESHLSDWFGYEYDDWSQPGDNRAVA